MYVLIVGSVSAMCMHTHASACTLCVCMILTFFCRRLLSGIPAKGMLPPGPDDECCSDFGEMCNVTHAWGSDNRGLKMAATTQMLNEGQRSGQKQIIWQK